MEPEQKTIRALLIEDDEDDYLVTREYLAKLGDHEKYALDWEKTYQAGLEQIRRDEYDIYLVDYCLGEGSGLDLLQEASRAGRQAPIIMITGHTNPEIDHAAMMSGAADYLVKGQINEQILKRAIRYALERNRLLKEIHELAVRDALTGLYNRREFHHFLENELAKCQRYSRPLSLLMMDIDHFKDINDRFGHRTGDEVLQHIAHVLLSKVRSCDMLARYGGDEFSMVMPETSASHARQGAERLRKGVEARPIKVNYEKELSKNVNVTISIGVTAYPGDAGSVDVLIESADKALYHAKSLGCNRVVGFYEERAKGDRYYGH
jgi:diguanylate cyclase (GGDEF)-like protein